MRFFKHRDAGVPTYINVERRDLDWNSVTNSNVDETLDVVLHCETDYFKFSQFTEEFVRKFKMTPITDMFVLPIQCIVAPILVVPDFEDAG
jgi:hypothetical protein